MISLRWLIAAVLMGPSGLAGFDAGACLPPPYFVAVDATERIKGLEDVPGYQYVSIARPALTLKNLRCLAKTLRDEPIAKIGLSVYVFDARWAAADFDGGDVMTMTREIAQSFRYLRARIEIDPKAGEQSLTLTPLGHKRGEEFELVAGERRWRAAQRAGLREVLVVVRDLQQRTPDERQDHGPDIERDHLIGEPEQCSDHEADSRKAAETSGASAHSQRSWSAAPGRVGGF